MHNKITPRNYEIASFHAVSLCTNISKELVIKIIIDHWHLIQNVRKIGRGKSDIVHKPQNFTLAGHINEANHVLRCNE